MTLREGNEARRPTRLYRVRLSNTAMILNAIGLVNNRRGPAAVTFKVRTFRTTPGVTPAQDNKWWTQHIIVKGNKVTVKIEIPIHRLGIFDPFFFKAMSRAKLYH